MRARSASHRIDNRCTAAGCRVAVDTAGWTQTFAIFTAQHERWDCKDPPFADCPTDVNRARLPIQQEYIRVIVQTVLVRADEQTLDRIACPHRHLRQAPGAFTNRHPFEIAGEIVPPVTGAREPTVHRYRRTGPNISFEPNRIAGIEGSLQRDGLSIETAEIH